MKDKKQYLVVKIKDGETYVAALPFDEEDQEVYSIEVLTKDEARSLAGENGVWFVFSSRGH